MIFGDKWIRICPILNFFWARVFLIKFRFVALKYNTLQNENNSPIDSWRNGSPKTALRSSQVGIFRVQSGCIMIIFRGTWVPLRFPKEQRVHMLIFISAKVSRTCMSAEELPHGLDQIVDNYFVAEIVHETQCWLDKFGWRKAISIRHDDNNFDFALAKLPY